MNFEDKLKQRYSGEGGKAYHDTKRSVPDSAYSWIAKLRAEKIEPQINPGDTVLEYGVGTGWNLAQIKCKRRLGFDLSEHLEPLLQNHGMEFVKNIDEVADESIDVVICHHVLEHTGSPSEILKQIKRILRPDGKLLLFVPFEKERRYRRYNPEEANHHLYSWNVQTLGNLVSDMGFNIIRGRIQEFGYDRFASVWSARLGWGQGGFRLIRKAIHLIKPASEVYIIAKKQ
jgi:SAM-dependent methyltransferase